MVDRTCGSCGNFELPLRGKGWSVCSLLDMPRSRNEACPEWEPGPGWLSEEVGPPVDPDEIEEQIGESDHDSETEGAD